MGKPLKSGEELRESSNIRKRRQRMRNRNGSEVVTGPWPEGSRPVARPSRDRPAVQGPVSRDTPDVPLPPAGRRVQGITDGAALLAGGAIGWGNAGMLAGTMEYLNPGWGVICAASLVGGEAIAGHLLECNRHTPGVVRLLCVLLVLLFPVGEVMLSFVREVSVHQGAVLAAERETSQPVKSQCERETMPSGLNSYRITAWEAGQAQRDQAYQTCRDHEHTARRQSGGEMVKAADTHSIFETPARALLSVLMSVVVALAATRFRPFWRSLAGEAPSSRPVTKPKRRTR